MRKISLFFCVVFLLPSLVLATVKPLAETFGPTKACDDLWQIASHISVDQNVSTQQVMIALVQKNPKAFFKHNINGLMQGYVLQIPTIAKIKSVPYHQAFNKINTQNREWRHIIGRLSQQPTQEYLKLKTHLCAPNHVVMMKQRLHYPRVASSNIDNEIDHLQTQTANLSEQLNTIQQQKQSLEQQVEALNNQNQSLIQQNAEQAHKIQTLMQTQSVSVAQQQSTQTTQQNNADLQQSTPNTMNLSANQQMVPPPHNVASKMPTSERGNMTFKQYLSLNWWKGHMMDLRMVSVVVTVIIILLIFLLLLLRGKKHVVVKELSPEEPLETQHVDSDELDSVLPTEVDLPEHEEISDSDKTDKSNNYHYLSGEDVVSSKLDLAKAYVEMGDYEHAHEMLESVMKEGNQEQKDEAQLILDQIAEENQ